MNAQYHMKAIIDIAMAMQDAANGVNVVVSHPEFQHSANLGYVLGASASLNFHVKSLAAMSLPESLEGANGL